MSLQRWGKCLLAATLALAVRPGALRADVTGSILGNAHDSTGAMVSVHVAAINVQTNLRQETVTDQGGEYCLLSVIVVNVFPPEGHRRVNGPGREGGQGQDAGPFGGSGDGLQDDCFAFPPFFLLLVG